MKLAINQKYASFPKRYILYKINAIIGNRFYNKQGLDERNGYNKRSGTASHK